MHLLIGAGIEGRCRNDSVRQGQMLVTRCVSGSVHDNKPSSTATSSQYYLCQQRPFFSIHRNSSYIDRLSRFVSSIKFDLLAIFSNPLISGIAIKLLWLITESRRCSCRSFSYGLVTFILIVSSACARERQTLFASVLFTLSVWERKGFA